MGQPAIGIRSTCPIRPPRRRNLIWPTLSESRLTRPAQRRSTILLTSDGVVTFSNNGASDATLIISDDALIESDLMLAQFLTTGDVNLNIADLLLVGGGSTFSVSQGAAVTANMLDLGITGSGNGTILVDGVGSSLAVAGTNRIGGFGKTGTLTFQNGSVGNSLSGLTQLIGGSSATNSTGRLSVLSGASLQTASINVGLSNSASAVQEGTLTVSRHRFSPDDDWRLDAQHRG